MSFKFHFESTVMSSTYLPRPTVSPVVVRYIGCVQGYSPVYVVTLR